MDNLTDGQLKILIELIDGQLISFKIVPLDGYPEGMPAYYNELKKLLNHFKNLTKREDSL